MNIKQLKKEKLDTLIKECKVFFAFNNNQFQSNKTESENGKYTAIAGGGYCPSSLAQSFSDGLDELYKWEIEQRKSQTNEQKEKHIMYELNNHECFYVGSIEDAYAVLSDFYTKDEVQAVFSKNYADAVAEM